MKRNNLLHLVLIVLLGLLSFSCSSFREPKPGEPGSAELYELAWVHPRVIAADQYYTLITSERLDSFLVARENAQPDGPPSVVFTVAQDDCDVRGDLSAVYDAFKVPIFKKTLQRGIYKLSLNPAQYTQVELPPGQYQVIVQACDLIERDRFFRD